MRRFFAMLVFMPALVVLLGATGCTSAPMTGRQQVMLVGTGEMLNMSRQQYQQVLEEEQVVTSGPEYERLQRVGRRIQTACEAYSREEGLNLRFEWEYNLIKDDEQVNAWAMPGGKIAFYTGIMPICRDDTGVAVVMGHELGHVLARHGAERVSQNLLAQVGLASLGAALSEQPEETRAMWMAAAGVGVQVGVLLPYSRTHEYEADHIGTILMARAGYDPRAAIAFWERMERQGGAKPPELLSTHPAGSNRIAALRRLMPEAMRYYRPGETSSALPTPAGAGALVATAQTRELSPCLD